jgi:uncharacterized RmlC-like cupin family protein
VIDKLTRQVSSYAQTHIMRGLNGNSTALSPGDFVPMPGTVPHPQEVPQGEPFIYLVIR